MSQLSWSPDQYEKFRREREAPFEDLMALVRRPCARAVDLGCGTGELTRRLHELVGGEVLGIDSSSEMLARAQPRPGLRFEPQTIEAFADGGDGEWDLVFSHAALHWVPDHATLMPRLLRRVRRGGQLAVQMPSNHDHPAHAIIAEVAGWRRSVPLRPIAEYAELLWSHGARELTVFEKVYCHELADADALLEWVRGTALLPYLERVPEADRAAFTDEVRARYRRRWPAGPLLFAFRRTLFCATRV